MASGDGDLQSRTTLIVNYLPQNMTDEEFRQMFLKIGPLRVSRIIRDRTTGYSFGYGFIDYVNPVHAETAIQTLNRLPIESKTLKVAYARPGGETIKNAKLYIRNLPTSMTEEELEALFCKYGSIVQRRILKDQFTGNSIGVGFVLFAQRNQAEDALGGLNGIKAPDGQYPLSIKFAEEPAKKIHPPQNPYGGGGGGSMGGFSMGMGHSGGMGKTSPPTIGGASGDHSQGHTLFVYNIGSDSDEKTLWQLFSPYGIVQKCNVMRDQQTGASRGFGFVTMMNYTEACWAIQNLNGFSFAGGKRLQVSFKRPK